MEGINIQGSKLASIVCDNSLPLLECQFSPAVTVSECNRWQTAINLPGGEELLGFICCKLCFLVTSDLLWNSVHGEHPLAPSCSDLKNYRTVSRVSLLGGIVGTPYWRGLSPPPIRGQSPPYGYPPYGYGYPPYLDLVPPCSKNFRCAGNLTIYIKLTLLLTGLILYWNFFNNLCITFYIQDKYLLDTLLINYFVATESRAIPPLSGPSPPPSSPPPPGNMKGKPCWE